MAVANDTVYRSIRKNMENKPSIDDISLQTGIPKDTLGDIERGSKVPSPEDVVTLSNAYESKRLCKWYCGNECPVGKHIGMTKVDGLSTEQLGLISLSLIDSINSLQKLDLQRLVEISKDGMIDVTETSDYNDMKKSLKKLAKAYESLIRWEEDGNTVGVPVPENDEDDE